MFVPRRLSQELFFIFADLEKVFDWVAREVMFFALRQKSVPEYFVCRTCVRHKCSVEEKLEFKRCEDVLEEVEKLSYQYDMISCYGRTSEKVCARIFSSWKMF